MARPLKNNADYFSHDANMRNDRKVKAIRAKFGLEGYAVWCMFLEILTDSNNFQILLDEVELELIAGDIGICAARLNEMITYFQRLKLLEIVGDHATCPSLIERFKPLLDKRRRGREYASGQKTKGQIHHTDGLSPKGAANQSKNRKKTPISEFLGFSTPKTELSLPKTPIVKKSKVKNKGGELCAHTPKKRSISSKNEKKRDKSLKGRSTNVLVGCVNEVVNGAWSTFLRHHPRGGLSKSQQQKQVELMQLADFEPLFLVQRLDIAATKGWDLAFYADSIMQEYQQWKARQLPVNQPKKGINHEHSKTIERSQYAVLEQVAIEGKSLWDA